MNSKQVNQELFSFLDQSPNAFFAVRNMCEMLDKAGMTRLYEGLAWKLESGKGYYVTRNDSALIAFRIPKADYTGFQMMASHCDSPVFKVKTNAEITIDDQYVKLNVEKYGGMLCAPWLDRPLSAAGRVIVRTETGIETRLVNVDRDLMIIPNLAIHMNREVNDGYKYNAQVDMLPLFCEKGKESDGFLQLIASEAGVSVEDILDTDYNPEITPVINTTSFDSGVGYLRTALETGFDGFSVGNLNYTGELSAKLSDYNDLNRQVLDAVSNNAIDYGRLGVSVANALINSGVHVELDGGQFMGYLAGEIQDVRRQFA